MEKGVIRMVDRFKGFGFILSEDDDEYYFNLKDVNPKYRNAQFMEGDAVGFDIKREMQGDRATNVRKL